MYILTDVSILVGDISKCTHIGNLETFKCFMQLRIKEMCVYEEVIYIFKPHDFWRYFEYGLQIFYRKFIENFRRLCSPIVNTIKEKISHSIGL